MLSFASRIRMQAFLLAGYWTCWFVLFLFWSCSGLYALRATIMCCLLLDRGIPIGCLVRHRYRYLSSLNLNLIGILEGVRSGFLLHPASLLHIHRNLILVLLIWVFIYFGISLLLYRRVLLCGFSFGLRHRGSSCLLLLLQELIGSVSSISCILYHSFVDRTGIWIFSMHLLRRRHLLSMVHPFLKVTRSMGLCSLHRMDLVLLSALVFVLVRYLSSCLVWCSLLNHLRTLYSSLESLQSRLLVPLFLLSQLHYTRKLI